VNETIKRCVKDIIIDSPKSITSNESSLFKRHIIYCGHLDLLLLVNGNTSLPLVADKHRVKSSM